MTKTTTASNTITSGMFNDPSQKKKKKQANNKNVLVETIPEYTKFCLCHQSSSLRYVLKGKGRRRFQTSFSTEGKVHLNWYVLKYMFPSCPNTKVIYLYIK